MRRLVIVLVMLAACTPQATLADRDDAALSFRELPSYDLAVAANAPIERGEVQVAGLELVIESLYCDLPDCVPGPDGWVRLTFDEEPDASYGNRFEIKVLSGIPIRGRALMVLSGEDLSRPAPLQTIP